MTENNNPRMGKELYQEWFTKEEAKEINSILEKKDPSNSELTLIGEIIFNINLRGDFQRR